MSLNNYQPQILIIPEDSAIHDICVGFEGRVITFAKGNAIRVDRWAGGRENLSRKLREEELEKLRKFPLRVLVLVRDFDGDPQCGDRLLDEVEPELRERVFVVGPLKEAENLRQEMRAGGRNTLEAIGEAIYDNCRTDVDQTETVSQLGHLTVEFARLRSTCSAILGFGTD